MDILLKYKAEPNWIDVFGRTPLYYSVMQESSVILEKLLNTGSNPDLYGCPNDSVEHYEIEVENEKMLSTPLHLAVQVNSYPMVRFLVDKGCKLNVKSWD